MIKIKNRVDTTVHYYTFTRNRSGGVMKRVLNYYNI